MQVTIAADANNNSPVVFSVILPRNQAVFRKLLDLTAKQWFAQREQLLRDYRTDLDETYYEFVPGQPVSELLQKGGKKNGVAQGIMFVNYQTSGAHRYTFDAGQPMKVSFGQRSLTFAP
jgi:type VI secretion system protein